MSPGFLDLLRELSGADARFLVVGAYAVGVHGQQQSLRNRAWHVDNDHTEQWCQRRSTSHSQLWRAALDQ